MDSVNMTEEEIARFLAKNTGVLHKGTEAIYDMLFNIGYPSELCEQISRELHAEYTAMREKAEEEREIAYKKFREDILKSGLNIISEVVSE
jgi:hypothetical protein